MYDPDKCKIIAKETMEFIKQKSENTDAASIMLVLSFLLALALNNIQDNIGEKECYEQVDKLHQVIDHFYSYYAQRGALPKDDRPPL